jgi:O-acetylserine/cysteine efflux transporter
MTAKDILLAIIISFLWGSNFIAAKLTLIEIPGFLSLAIRFLATGLVLLPFASRERVKIYDLYTASLVFGIFYLGLLYNGLSLGINTSLAIIITQLHVPISAIIAIVVFKERLNLQIIMGITLAFLGMLLVAGAPHIVGHFRAAAIILMSAFFCAIFNIQSKKFKAISPISFVCWSNLIAAPHAFLISFYCEGSPFELLEGTSSNLVFALLYTIFAVGVVAVTLWVYLLKKYPVYMVLPFNLLVPFFGIGLSIFILGDVPSWHVFVGFVVTILGIALTNLKPKSMY